MRPPKHYRSTGSATACGAHPSAAYVTGHVDDVLCIACLRKLQAEVREALPKIGDAPELREARRALQERADQIDERLALAEARAFLEGKGEGCS